MIPWLKPTDAKKLHILWVAFFTAILTLSGFLVTVDYPQGNVSQFGQSANITVSGATETLREREVKKWTVMIYMDADNDLEDIGIDDFNELENVGSNSQLNIVVQFDRIGGYDSSNGDWTTARRYYVTKDDTYDPFTSNPDRTIRSQLIEDLGEVNMGSPETLKNFLYWAMGNYSAEHYLLVLWDHGSGIFKRSTIGTRGICIDTTSGRELKLWEVGKVLNDITTYYNTTIDIIGFDVCSLGAVETAYELMPYADYMIASADEEPDWGWDYTSAIGEIEANPDISPRELARKATIHFLNQYSEDYVTQATVDLRYFATTYLNKLNVFADSLNYFMYEYRYIIKNIRNQTHTYTYDRADIGDFASRIYKSNELPTTLRTSAKDFLDVINNTVIEKGCGATHLNMFYGMYIYFPINYYNGAYSNLISFSNERWDEFLRRFINPTPVGVVIDHVPLRDTEDTNNGYYVVAEIKGDTRDASNISVRYTVNSGITFNTIHMENMGGDTFRCKIPPQANNTDVYYYIKALDIFGNISTYPINANESKINTLLHFRVGLDYTPPHIIHEQLTDTMDMIGPYIVSATVTDNMGVDTDSVYLEWYVEEGLLRFNATQSKVKRTKMVCNSPNAYGEGIYMGEIPGQKMGSVVFYRIVANDTSINKNTATVPMDDFFVFKVLSPYGQILVDYYHGNDLSNYNNSGDYIDTEKYVVNVLTTEIYPYTLKPYDLFVSIRPLVALNDNEKQYLYDFIRDGGNMILIPSQNILSSNSFLNFTGAYLAQLPTNVTNEISGLITYEKGSKDELLMQNVSYLSFNYETVQKTAIFGSGYTPLVYDSSGKYVMIGYCEIGYGHGKILIIPDGCINFPYIELYNNRMFASNILKWIFYNEPPVSVINVTDDDFNIGDNITLDGFDSYDGDGYIVNYTWIVDGKDIYYGPEITINFTTSGDHSVILIVVDNDNARDESEMVIHIAHPPIIKLTCSVGNGGTTLTYTTITFDATQSYDPDGEDIMFIWDMGDGNIIEGQDIINYSYSKPGTYYITLTATDSQGLTDEAIWMIIVEARNPTADFDFFVYKGRDISCGRYIPTVDRNGFYNIYEDYLIVFDASNTTDMDNTIDELNFTWDFGDGTYGYGINVSHYYTRIKNYDVSLIVTDIYGKTHKKTVTFSVINPAPLVELKYKPEGDKIKLWIAYLNDTESDRYNLTIIWDLGDGTVYINRTQVTHRYKKPGTYSINLTVRDDEGAYNYTVLNITITEKVPLFGDANPYVQAILVIILIVLVSSMVLDKYKEHKEKKKKLNK